VTEFIIIFIVRTRKTSQLSGEWKCRCRR